MITIEKSIRNDAALRASFNALAKQTFGLNFEGWYQNGFWQEQYQPYAAVENGRVLAVVAVSRMDCLLHGRKRQFLQLGTVMTAPEHRHKGLSRLLLEEIRRDFQDCDGIYLYGNDSVLDFYPKFGFEKRDEYRFRLCYSPDAIGTAEQVSMQTEDDWSRCLSELHRRKNAGDPAMQNDGLLMFYLSQFLRNCVYYLPAFDAYVIAEPEDGRLLIDGVYAGKPFTWTTLCAAFGPQYSIAELAFTPADKDGLEQFLYTEEDTTFFVSGDILKQELPEFLDFPALFRA